MIRYSQKTRGFTLIELMISLVLGLLITAAVIQIYITMVRTKTIQLSGSDVQDASVFGIQSLESTLRLANLGSNIPTNINDESVGTGVVISNTNVWGITDISNNLLTNSTGDTVSSGDGAWTGLSDIATSTAFDATGTTDIGTGSDQLTIQYKNITGEQLHDCEGNGVSANDIVIERYFIRPSTNTNYGNVLACDAGRIDPVAKKVTNFASKNAPSARKGDEYILNVNQFKVLLGTQSADGKMAYYTPHDYRALSGTKPSIVAVKIGLIVRGSKPLINNQQQETFKLFGAQQTLTTAAKATKYIRKPYESTTMLRNARVITVAKNLAQP